MPLEDAMFKKFDIARCDHLRAKIWEDASTKPKSRGLMLLLKTGGSPIEAVYGEKFAKIQAQPDGLSKQIKEREGEHLKRLKKRRLQKQTKHKSRNPYPCVRHRMC